MPALVPAEEPVEAPRDRTLGQTAGEHALELLAEGAARAKEERFNVADGDAEEVSELGIAAPFDLAHDQGGALGEGKAPET